MEKQCSCDGWQEHIEDIEYAMDAASASELSLEDLEMCFCPWCGKKLRKIMGPRTPPEPVYPPTSAYGPTVSWEYPDIDEVVELDDANSNL